MTCTRSHPHEPEDACDGSVRHLYAKGVYDERERIIKLLTTDDDPIWLCNLCRGEFAPLGGRRVRTALTPKP